VPAIGDPGGTMIVKKKERARIRVAGQGDTIAIGGLVMFDPSTATLTAGQEKAIDRIADELAGKQQVVEIVATASNRAQPPGSPFRDRWELGYARCRTVADLLAARKIEPSRFRLSVVPGYDAAGGEKYPEVDDAVRVNLSATLSPGGK
jgi:flagellar motor protein MotB